MPDPERAPRLARPFVALLLAAAIASAVFVLEPWPFTSFRLFSHLRTDQQFAWRASAVDARGIERDYPLGSLPHGFRGFSFVMAEFVEANSDRRHELCRTWVRAAPGLIGHEAVAVRIYRREWLLSDREGSRALPGTERLAFTCDDEGVDAG